MTFEEEMKEMRKRVFELENQLGYLTAMIEQPVTMQLQYMQMRQQGAGIHCDRCSSDLMSDQKVCPAHDPKCKAGLDFLEPANG